MKRTAQQKGITQKERSEQVQNQLIEATISSLCKRGYVSTTTQDIVRNANCTTGAIQHHFGSKNALFVAVLDVLFGEFEMAFISFPDISDSLGKRCTVILSELNKLYTSARYRAVYELSLGARQDEELSQLVTLQRRKSISLLETKWVQAFSDIDIPKQEFVDFLHIILSVLRGFHFYDDFDHKMARIRVDRQLEFLEKQMLLLLASRR